MSVRLEHANMIVRDIDATIRFLTIAIPEFRIRFDGMDALGHRWVHLGTDETYIALMQATSVPDEPVRPYSGVPGVNHIAYEVDDVAALRRRLSEAGYQDSTVENSHPWRKRVYFYDPDGNDWEFVQYLTDDMSLRNDYAISDR